MIFSLIFLLPVIYTWHIHGTIDMLKHIYNPQ
jgi:hypothetical protein